MHFITSFVSVLLLFISSFSLSYVDASNSKRKASSSEDVTTFDKSKLSYSRNSDDKCENYPRFADSLGDGCDFYEASPDRFCTDSYKNRDGDSSNDACCVCGGGIIPSSDGGGESCQDVPNYKDKDSFGCSYYDDHSDQCLDRYANSEGVSPNEACCICGGGNTDDPVNKPWVGKYFIRAALAPEYLSFSENRGVHMSQESNKMIIDIVVNNGNYALKHFCAYENCEDTYLTIKNPFGSAYVDTTDRLTVEDEFAIEASEITVLGTVSFKQVTSGRYIGANKEEVRITKTVSIHERFVLEEYLPSAAVAAS